MSCEIPLCPVLLHYRSSPVGEEYGGKADLRVDTGCEDLCVYRPGFMGPACTIVMAGHALSNASKTTAEGYASTEAEKKDSAF